VQAVQLLTVVSHLSLIKIMLLERERMGLGLLGKVCFAETVEECQDSCISDGCIGDAGIEN
jgi:hypothetical protein